MFRRSTVIWVGLALAGLLLINYVIKTRLSVLSPSQLPSQSPSTSPLPLAPLKEVKNGLIVIPIFPLVIDDSYNKSNFFNYSRNKLEARMLDFMESLEKTLNHPFVNQVHIPFDQEAMPEYVTSQLGHHPKLRFHKLSDTYMATNVLDFVHKTFLGKLVMITNGDIYPGEGFEKLDYNLMKGKHLFYTPTRHGRQEKRCKMPPDFCDPGVQYQGAHDCYIFTPTSHFPKEGLSLLKPNKWDSYGTENVMLYIYKDILHYKVLNPCKVIFLYHNHCSGLTHNDRVRYMPRSSIVLPSAQLE